MSIYLDRKLYLGATSGGSATEDINVKYVNSADNEDGQLIGTLGLGDYQAIVTNVSSKVWLKSLGDETPVNIQAI